MNNRDRYRSFIGRLGYYDYQQGLILRSRDQKEGWDSHLANCRNYILDAVRSAKPEKITVLGSGWLLDFPIAEILEMGIPLNLIDIAHPPDVLKQLSAYPMVTFTEMDLTGGLAEEIRKNFPSFAIFRKSKDLSDITVPSLVLDENPGLVISLNLLSQLDVLLSEYLRKRARFTENGLLRFRSEIQQKHLDFLLKNNSILISDVEEVIFTRSGESSTEKTVVIDLPHGKNRKEWTWDFDLKKSDYNMRRSVLKVVAITPGK